MMLKANDYVVETHCNISKCQSLNFFNQLVKNHINLATLQFLYLYMTISHLLEKNLNPSIKSRIYTH